MFEFLPILIIGVVMLTFVLKNSKSEDDALLPSLPEISDEAVHEVFQRLHALFPEYELGHKRLTHLQDGYAVQIDPHGIEVRFPKPLCFPFSMVTKLDFDPLLLDFERLGDAAFDQHYLIQWRNPWALVYFDQATRRRCADLKHLGISPERLHFSIGIKSSLVLQHVEKNVAVLLDLARHFGQTEGFEQTLRRALQQEQIPALRARLAAIWCKWDGEGRLADAGWPDPEDNVVEAFLHARVARANQAEFFGRWLINCPEALEPALVQQMACFDDTNQAVLVNAAFYAGRPRLAVDCAAHMTGDVARQSLLVLVTASIDEFGGSRVPWFGELVVALGRTPEHPDTEALLINLLERRMAVSACLAALGQNGSVAAIAFLAAYRKRIKSDDQDALETAIYLLQKRHGLLAGTEAGSISAVSTEGEGGAISPTADAPGSLSPPKSIK